MSQTKEATELLERHEEDTGRCFTRVCKWNTEEGCEKPIDSPCPQLWFLTGDKTAGIGLDLKRKWRKLEESTQ